jgi:hypothetical protein
MTHSDIMGLAAEANLWVTSDERLDAVKKFATLVAAAEREACAKIADNHRHTMGILASNPPQSAAAFDIAIDIRARGAA